MTITVTKVSHNQAKEVLKLVVLNVLSFGLSLIPAYLAKNPAYVSLMLPISFVVSYLQKLFTQDEAVVTSELPPVVMSGVNELLQEEDKVLPEAIAPVIEPPVTNEAGQPVLDPNAPR